MIFSYRWCSGILGGVISRKVPSLYNNHVHLYSMIPWKIGDKNDNGARFGHDHKLPILKRGIIMPEKLFCTHDWQIHRTAEDMKLCCKYMSTIWLLLSCTTMMMVFFIQLETTFEFWIWKWWSIQILLNFWIVVWWLRKSMSPHFFVWTRPAPLPTLAEKWNSSMWME